jgi:hypothetical protein
MIDKMTQDQREVLASTVKAGSVWATIGVSSWADVASVLAAFLSLLFIIEWFWKKVFRPLLEDKGLVVRKHRRKTDDEPDTDRVGL